MELSKLQSVTRKRKRRLGQGHGSGRGKTGGRGTKGQKARGDMQLTFEGGALSLIKRLPFMRGRGHNKPFGQKPAVLNVSDLNSLAPKTIVTKEVLVKNGIIKEEVEAIKILGNGTLTVALSVQLPVSKQAAAKIEKAGGSTEALPGLSLKKKIG